MVKFYLAAFSLLILCTTLQATATASDTAVMLVDMQVNFLDGAKHQQVGMLLKKQIEVLKVALERGYKVMVFEYDEMGETAPQIRALLAQFPPQNVVYLSKGTNGGLNPDFDGDFADEILRGWGIRKLLLLGLNALACIRETGLGAVRRGYEVYSSHDVVTHIEGNDRTIHYPWCKWETMYEFKVFKTNYEMLSCNDILGED